MKHRTFKIEDQISFAKLSGDYNPLHVDVLAARRLLFGSLAVHGIHALLWALDCCLDDIKDNVELLSIKATFPKPIKVGEEVSLLLIHKEDGRYKVKLENDGSTVTRLEFEIGKSKKTNFDSLKKCFPPKKQSRVLSNAEIENESGSLNLCLNIENATAMFPNLLRCVSPLQIAAIISTSRLVGVECPGLHSIYAALELFKTKSSINKSLNYEVTKVDGRGLVFIKINMLEMVGVIKAFLRPPPKKQEDYISLKEQVKNNEFAGQRALIIGGSRGLGEVATKLLAGGGADVKITYHQGMKDAHRIVDDIISNGGVADSFHFDVLIPKIETSNISINNWVPTHLYYFATPFISTSKENFSSQLFYKFCDYYVIGFINTVNLISKLGTKRIFNPSTIFIDELPVNLGEYAVAKHANEFLCTFIEKTNKEMIIYKPRLPRMATDQTVSIMPITSQNPATVLIKELRAFRDINI